MKLSLFAELRRRNVFKAAAAYLALGWIVVQITATLVPALNLPSSLVPIVTWIGVIGFPFVIMFSWIYELTPEGLKRESEVDRSASITHITSRRLDYITISLAGAGDRAVCVRPASFRAESNLPQHRVKRRRRPCRVRLPRRLRPRRRRRATIPSPCCRS